MAIMIKAEGKAQAVRRFGVKRFPQSRSRAKTRPDCPSASRANLIGSKNVLVREA
jgi:hypothetical protein